MASLHRSSLLFLVSVCSSPRSSLAGNLRSTGAGAARKPELTEKDAKALSYCQDTTAKFQVQDMQQDCKWLQTNLSDYEYLCDLLGISSLCRVTCGICEDTIRAVELLETCNNEVGLVEYVGNSEEKEEEIFFDCKWLKKNRDVYPAACSTTAVALFCPVVCDPFGLGPCIALDPHSTTGKNGPLAAASGNE